MPRRTRSSSWIRLPSDCPVNSPTIFRTSTRSSHPEKFFLRPEFTQKSGWCGNNGQHMRRRAMYRTFVTMLALLSPLFAQSSAYHVVATYELGGTGGLDYIVPKADLHWVFVGHTDGVMVG